MSARWYISVGGSVLAHPSLVPTAVRQLWRLRRRSWWRNPPFLPIAHAEYLRFRMLTAYGDPVHIPARNDVLNYLRWCRAWPHVTA